MSFQSISSLDHDGRVVSEYRWLTGGPSVDRSDGSQNQNEIKTRRDKRVHLGASNHREDFSQIFMQLCDLTGSAVILTTSGDSQWRIPKLDVSKQFLDYMSYRGCPRQHLVFEALVRDGDAIFSRGFFAGTLVGNMESPCRSKFRPDTAGHAFYTHRNNGPCSVSRWVKKSPSVTDLVFFPLIIVTVMKYIRIITIRTGSI